MQSIESLCPVCLKKIQGRLIEEGDLVFLVKTCPEHGEFKTKIWNGPPDFQSWRRPKIPKVPDFPHKDKNLGCPFDCGLCPDHRQRSCTIVFEVTSGCNLGCPICFANSGLDRSPDPPLREIQRWFDQAHEASSDCNIQLSGGEPTIRDDLPEIVEMGRRRGYDFIQVNTNGLRAAWDEDYVKKLRQAGTASVFLQFDGTDDKVYEEMRGRKLLAEKIKAIECFGRNGIGVVLVPTIIPGINDQEAGAILKTAVDYSPVVRGVHFQPFSHLGRRPWGQSLERRLTLPELMRLIEEQTQGAFQVSHFHPPGCENALCSFSANYLLLPNGEVKALAQPFGSCCREPEPAEKGAMRTISRVAKQWSAPEHEGKNKITEAPGPCRGQGSNLISLDDFLARARTHTLSVSAMAFQDAWSLDLDRLRDCCIHVMAPDGCLIPFCAYNLTAVDGRYLYRR